MRGAVRVSGGVLLKEKPRVLDCIKEEPMAEKAEEESLLVGKDDDGIVVEDLVLENEHYEVV